MPSTKELLTGCFSLIKVEASTMFCLMHSAYIKEGSNVLSCFIYMVATLRYDEFLVGHPLAVRRLHVCSR